MKLIDIIAGARPNFMKIAPLVEALDKQKEAGGSLGYRLIHTGQHYDRNMSGSFFEQLGIPAPAVNFGVGGGSQAEQTAGTENNRDFQLVRRSFHSYWTDEHERAK